MNGVVNVSDGKEEATRDQEWSDPAVEAGTVQCIFNRLLTLLNYLALCKIASSPPRLIVFSTLLCLLSSSSSLPPLLPSSQSSHLSLGLPRLLLPSSRNSAALSGSCHPRLMALKPYCSTIVFFSNLIIDEVVSDYVHTKCFVFFARGISHDT